MNASDIKDEETLEAWLETRPQADSAALAHRTALRVAPLWLSAMDKDWALSGKLTALPVLRLNLAIGATRMYPTLAAQDVAGSASVAFSYGPSFNFDRVPDSFRAAARAAVHASRAVTHVVRGANHAANSASSAFSSAASGFSFNDWTKASLECLLLEAGQTLDGVVLWPDAENPLQAEWRHTQTLWAAQGNTYAFWLRWYDAALEGRSLNPELERDIALIPDADWEKGAEHIAGLIAGLERKYADEDRDPIDRALTHLPPANQNQRASFAQAVTAHQQELPATLEAILGFCGMEISRLQGRNRPYATPEDEAEAQRQIRVLTTIYATLERLKAEIPEAGALTEANIEKGEKLTRVFVRHFKDWPHKNADDLVDSTCRAALVGLTATLAPMIGVPVNIAVGAGVVLFGGKKIADGLKSAKDMAGL